MSDSEREWTISELARVAGVSARTLRHYDHVGLLKPAARSVGGRRCYGIAEVERLYRILALRSLGVSLRAIAEVFGSEEPRRLIEIVRMQRLRVEHELELASELRGRLLRIETRLARAELPSTNDLLDLMEVLTMTVNLTRIYTRLGDGGETDLGDQTRVPKSHPRVEAYGSVDELNAHIGLALAIGGTSERDAGWLRQIQNDLFDVGADLCVPLDPVGTEDSRLRVTDEYVTWLERACDAANGPLEPVRSFLLPTGTPLAAQLHVCRTVCRRAERCVTRVDGHNPVVLRYLNRLSDLLFILSRSCNEAPESLWQPGASRAGAV